MQTSYIIFKKFMATKKQTLNFSGKIHILRTKINSQLFINFMVYIHFFVKRISQIVYAINIQILFSETFIVVSDNDRQLGESLFPVVRY